MDKLQLRIEGKNKFKTDARIPNLEAWCPCGSKGAREERREAGQFAMCPLLTCLEDIQMATPGDQFLTWALHSRLELTDLGSLSCCD